MKFHKSILYSIGAFFAFLTVLISLGSALCKFSVSPEAPLIRACGSIPYFWIIALSFVVFLIFILVRHLHAALLYLTLMSIFTILLFDFSFKFFTHRIPENTDIYDDLKVVAYNVKYYSSGIENIVKFIKESDFDIALLSESVLTSEKLEYLKNNLTAYSVITDNGHDLTLLSKYPVVSYKIVELPTYLTSFSGSNDIEKLTNSGIHRAFIHAVVDCKGTRINVLSVRLIAGRAKDKSIGENIKWWKYLLGAQNEELSVFLNYLGSLNGPVIFGGDLNVTPNSAIIGEIKRYADDTYLDEHAFGSFTFNTLFPIMRLDYIFHSKDIIVKNSGIVIIKLSDHFPLRAEFLIQR
jgi:endonuclease/exonuclease/phosphatase (EEP) superfamily protein YafD